MLSYSWGMTSNKRGCEAQTPSLVPPIEASPLLIYSHFGRPSGKVRRPCHNLGPGGAGGGERAIKTAKSLGRKGSQGGKGSGAGFVMDRRSRLLTLFHLTNRSKAAALLTAVRTRRFV